MSTLIFYKIKNVILYNGIKIGTIKYLEINKLYALEFRLARNNPSFREHISIL
jgi:hypothetical protein